jgi:hypothetical protein
MLLAVWFTTNNVVPEESITPEIGPVPAAKGEPVSAVSAPVFASTLKAETLFDCKFTTYMKAGVELVTNEIGPVPAAIGDARISASAPVVALIVIMEMLLLAELAT